MIQDSLVDYIASQVKLGVPRDSIKTALTGVGWVAQDVEDTFKKVEGGISPATAVAVPVQQPAAGNQPAVSVGRPASQNIRVSDLVSASLTPTSMSSGGGSASFDSTRDKPFAAGSAQKVSPKMMTDRMSPAAMSQAPKRMGKSAFVMIGLILILAGVSAYLYFQNSSLSAQVQTAGGQNQGVASQVSGLTSQVQALNASNTTLAAQIAQFSAQVQELQTDLSFFMVPTGLSAATPVAATVSGMLSGGKPVYTLTTAQGVKVYVKNSGDAAVRAALDPLLAAATAAQIAGTHNPGSPNVTVSSVNGTSVTKPAATSTATSSAPSATGSGQ